MKTGASFVALIPARAGSRRIPNKNVRELGGHPLLAYTIAAALESKCFDSVVVSTDSDEYADMARHYGAEVPFLRPANISGDLSPDIEWVEYTLRTLRDQGRAFDCFALLRPTSPFRKAATIRRAHQQFLSDPQTDSLRAVQKCKEHPGKMWVIHRRHMTPLLPLGPREQPWHSTPYQALPEVYIQNASLELAWCRVVFEQRTIAGDVVIPFVTEGDEGFDLNSAEDWLLCDQKVRTGQATVPDVAQLPWSKR